MEYKRSYVVWLGCFLVGVNSNLWVKGMLCESVIRERKENIKKFISNRIALDYAICHGMKRNNNLFLYFVVFMEIGGWEFS